MKQPHLIQNRGRKKSTGYPDIQFRDKAKRLNYLECKTYNDQNANSTQRTFYFSPSEDFKVTEDARHFLIAFETIVAGQYKSQNIYKVASYKIISIYDLLVDVKYEFNSDNRRLYASGQALAEGKLKT